MQATYVAIFNFTIVWINSVKYFSSIFLFSILIQICFDKSSMCNRSIKLITSVQITCKTKRLVVRHSNVNLEFNECWEPQIYCLPLLLKERISTHTHTHIRTIAQKWSYPKGMQTYLPLHTIWWWVVARWLVASVIDGSTEISL